MNELAHDTPPLDRSRRLGPESRRGLPSEDREAQLLWRLRYRVTRTQLRQLFTTARLRTFLVIGLSLFFWVGLFLLFYEGFQFIVDNVGAGRRDLSCANRAIRVSSVLCLAQRDAGVFVRHHSLHRACTTRRRRRICSRCRCARSGSSSTNFKRPCSSAAGVSSCSPARS